MKTPIIYVIFCCAHWHSALAGGSEEGGKADHHTKAAANPKDFLTRLHLKKIPLMKYKPKLLSAYQDFKKRSWKNDDNGVFGYKRNAQAWFPIFEKKSYEHAGIDLENLGASLYPGSWAGKTSFDKFRAFDKQPELEGKEDLY